MEPFDIKTGNPLKKKEFPSYTDVFSEKICELAGKNKRIVALTAAMPDGTGLTKFAKEFPKRFFDVGIAEAHEVTSAAGMAAAGLKPVVAVYSSFLQRGYDQVLHDVCIQDFRSCLPSTGPVLWEATGRRIRGNFLIFPS